MRKMATIALALIIALAALTACDQEKPRLLDVRVTSEGIITGTVQHGDHDNDRILVYLNDDIPFLDEGNINTPQWRFADGSGKLYIDLSGKSANSVTLFLVPENLDFTDKNKVTQNCHDKITLELTASPGGGGGAGDGNGGDEGEGGGAGDGNGGDEGDGDGRGDGGGDGEGEGGDEGDGDGGGDGDEESDAFYMFADDSAELSANRHMDYAYMPTGDGSISMLERSTSYRYAGEESTMFSYTPKSASHWGGVALLWKPGEWHVDPGENGPEPGVYHWCTFMIRGGNGLGNLDVYIEGNTGGQQLQTITLTDEWQEVSFEIPESWAYVDVPFAWSANASDLDSGVETLEFYLDDLKYIK